MAPTAQANSPGRYSRHAGSLARHAGSVGDAVPVDFRRRYVLPALDSAQEGGAGGR